MNCHEKLAHASGALSEIYTLVTSCVAIDAPIEVHELAEAVASRILSSAHKVHSAPAWFVHGWEERLWAEFESGKIHACGTDKPCNRIATQLDK